MELAPPISWLVDPGADFAAGVAHDGQAPLLHQVGDPLRAGLKASTEPSHGFGFAILGVVAEDSGGEGVERGQILCFRTLTRG